MIYGISLASIRALTLLAAIMVRSQESSSAERLPTLLERCWRAAEIKSSRNADFDQDRGRFHGEVRLRWCHTSIEAYGPVVRRGSRSYLTNIDSLTLRFTTDTITALLRDGPRGVQLIVNGHDGNAAWWRAGTRERVLRFSRAPLL